MLTDNRRDYRNRRSLGKTAPAHRSDVINRLRAIVAPAGVLTNPAPKSYVYERRIRRLANLLEVRAAKTHARRMASWAKYSNNIETIVDYCRCVSQ